MALKRNNTNRSGGGGRQNAVVELASVHTEGGSDPNFEKDYAIGYLLHDAFGKKAEYDDQGNPVTEIRFQVKKPDNYDPKKPAASIAKLNQDRGLWKKVVTGNHLVIENAYLDSRSDTVMARWLTPGSRDPFAGNEVCRINDSAKRQPSGNAFLTTVYTEKHQDRPDGSRNSYQYRVSLDQENAKPVSSLDDFKAKVVQMFHDMSNEGVAARFPEKGREFYQNNGDGRGQPCVYLRGVDVRDETGLYTDSGQVKLVWDREKGENGDFLSVEESIDAFLNDERNADLVGALSETHDENTYLEVIPAQVYKTGRDSLPSMKDRGGDDSARFPCPFLDAFGKETRRDDGSLSIGTGFAPGFITLGRKEGKPWFAKSTFRTEMYGPIFPLEEIVTPELPDHFRDLFEKRAAARNEIMKNKNKPAPAKDEPAMDESDPGEGLEFGAEMAPKGM